MGAYLSDDTYEDAVNAFVDAARRGDLAEVCLFLFLFFQA